MSQLFIKHLYVQNAQSFSGFPDKDLAEQFIDRLFGFLFLPKYAKNKHQTDLEVDFVTLKNTFFHLLQDIVVDVDKAQDIVYQFFDEIPAIYDVLIRDAHAILRYDPAAGTIAEVITAYPGFYATAVYRLSHKLYQLKIKILPRLFSEYAHSKTGIDIHPGATIGEPFIIDHGTGVVIGETCIIGDNVKIYQGVTLGALQVAKELAKQKRHPTIENNVVIYSGATILGGDTVVGHSSVIGGNVWLTTSVSSHSMVYHKSEVRVKDNNPLPDALNFII